MMKKEEQTLDELTLNQLKSAKNLLDKKVDVCYESIIKSSMDFIQNINNKGDNSFKIKFLKGILDNLLKYVTLNSKMDELNRNIEILEKEENQTGIEEQKKIEQKMEIVQEKNNYFEGDKNNNINSKFF